MRQGDMEYPYMVAYFNVRNTEYDFGDTIDHARITHAPADAVYYSGGWVRFYSLFPKLRSDILAYLDSRWGTNNALIQYTPDR
jgi:hypothetical protein